MAVPELSTLTGTRQTMMSWAKVIESFAEVPEIYRDACRPLVAGRPVFPYLVLAPTLGGTRHKDSEKLLCDVDDTLYVLEHAGKWVAVTGYPWSTARDIEFGNILLYAWITLSGVTTKGEPDTSTVVFNLATARYFAPLIRKLRPAPPAIADEAGYRAEQAKFGALASTSFKYMNFARESLAPGEKVLQTIWQPDLRRPIARVLGWSMFQTVSLAHLTLLTDKELILIWDDERSVKKAGMRYGGVWRYLPLRHLVSATVTERPDGCLMLALGLTANGQVEKIFDASHRAELEQLQRTLATLIGR
jgi:hypothetical protein